MKRIKVTHYFQDPSHCAVAAAATLANFHNPEIDYEKTKKIACRKFDTKSRKISDAGIDSPEICRLLNYLGFNSVTLITSDFYCVDYTWSNYGKRKMLETIKHSLDHKKDKEEKNLTRSLYKWYKLDGYDNNIKIDYNFGKYIRKYLNKKIPIIVTFNWTMFFKYVKDGEYGDDPVNGDFTEHAVVANGYDKNGVWIVDSHHQYYKYKRKKYRKGFYKISWENLMTVMGQGDVIIPSNYCI